MQDALERVVTRGDGVDAAHTWSWLVTVMHNLFIDECRRQRRRAAAEEPESGVAELAHASSPMSIDSPRPAWDHIGVEDVRAAVNELDEDHGAVYRMFAFEGRSYEEIARVTSLPRSTVGTRLLRARARLRRILVSRDTMEKCAGAFDFVPAGSYKVKGRTQEVDLFEPRRK